MADIRHRVGIDAPAERVYEALTTTEGISQWWTHDVRGDGAQGGELGFYFGSPEPSAVMRVTEAVPNTRVVWRCVAGVQEWIDTTFTFDLKETDGETVVLFTNADWREPVEFMHHCSTRWGYFLISLKLLLETGKGTPYPDDLKASRWG
jgi:uncharacterized protein YndB with AHSA1/START domain